MADFVGYAAGIINMIHLVPQLKQSFSTHKTRDISMSYTVIHAVGLFLWTIYGVLILSYPVIIMHAIEFLLALGLVGLKIKKWIGFTLQANIFIRYF